MNGNLLIIGTLLLILGFIIGVKQKIELITFVRNKRVKDKEKVANIVGGSQFVIGAVLITLGAIGFPYDQLAIVCVVVVVVITSIYVSNKYVE